MDIVNTIIGGTLATFALTLIIKNAYRVNLVPERWDVLEDGVAPLMHLNKKQVYVMHLVAEIILFPAIFVLVWVNALNINILGNTIVNSSIFAFIIFALASIVPIVKAPNKYKLKATFALLIARLTYGFILGTSLVIF